MHFRPARLISSFSCRYSFKAEAYKKAVALLTIVNTLYHLANQHTHDRQERNRISSGD